MALWWNSGHSMFFETLDYYIHDTLISHTPSHVYTRFTYSDSATLLISFPVCSPILAASNTYRKFPALGKIREQMHTK